MKRVLELRELSCLPGRTRPANFASSSTAMSWWAEPTDAGGLQASARLPDLDATVLVLGARGTGKELVAKAVHNQSPRKDRAFVVVNCAAIRSTFSKASCSAMKKEPSRMPSPHAHRGWSRRRVERSFLMRLATRCCRFRPNFCEFCRMEAFERAGGREHLNWLARVIAATNQDLTRLVSDNGFREDLFYRLNVITLRTPSLRDRRGDTAPGVPLPQEVCGQVRAGRY